MAESGGDTLQSKPDGSAQILWRKDAHATGKQWAIVRVGRPADPIYMVKVPARATVRITARNHSAQRIRGPIEGNGEDQYLVTPNLALSS